MSTPLQSLGRYRLVSLLGEGGMGQVYKAYDAALGRHVAVKILAAELLTDETRVSRFIQEARAASALNHPNVIVVHDIGEERGVLARRTADGLPTRITNFEENTNLSFAPLLGRNGWVVARGEFTRDAVLITGFR